jgi:hypothetical protein
MGSEDYDDSFDYEDTPEEVVEISKPDWMDEDCWEEINQIEDLEVRQDQIERKEKVHEQRVELDRKYKSGEIDDIGYSAGNLDQHFREARVATRRALRSVGLDYDQLGELSEKWDVMAKGDPDLIDANDRVNELVKRDPEAAQEIIDRMYEEGRLPDEVYEDACEMVNRHK